MENKNTVLIATLISICVFCLLFAIFLFRHVKSVESEYNAKEAGLVKEAMDLKDIVEEMKEAVRQKEEEINIVKADKDKMAREIELIKGENKKLNKSYTEQIETLKKRSETLEKEMKALKEMPLEDVIRKVLGEEKDENIKKVLEKTLSNIESVKAGDIVDLEPIVVAEEKEIVEAEEIAKKETRKRGKIISVDRDNNLIVIDLGKKDNAKNGERVIILDKGVEIASGEIINARYGISAAFIDDIKYRHTLSDVERGAEVLIEK